MADHWYRRFSYDRRKREFRQRQIDLVVLASGFGLGGLVIGGWTALPLIGFSLLCVQFGRVEVERMRRTGRYWRTNRSKDQFGL
jgi:hypothetical protein